MKTSGSPVASSQPPSPTAISVGGGRNAASVRTAVEPPAVSARRGTGPRRGGCRPARRSAGPGRPRDPAPPSGRPPRAGRRRGGCDGRAERTRRSTRRCATATTSPSEHDDRPEGRVDRRQRVGEVGQREDRERPRRRSPRGDRDLRDRARPPAEDERDDDQQERDGVERVHRPIVAQDGRGLRRSADGPRSADGDRIGAAPPVASLIV